MGFFRGPSKPPPPAPPPALTEEERNPAKPVSSRTTEDRVKRTAFRQRALSGRTPDIRTSPLGLPGSNLFDQRLDNELYSQRSFLGR